MLLHTSVCVPFFVCLFLNLAEWMCYFHFPASVGLSWNRVIAGDGGLMVEWVNLFFSDVVQWADCVLEIQQNIILFYRVCRVKSSLPWTKKHHCNPIIFFRWFWLFSVEIKQNTTYNIYLKGCNMYVAVYTDRLRQAVEFGSWNDYKDKDLFGQFLGHRLRVIYSSMVSN